MDVVLETLLQDPEPASFLTLGPTPIGAVLGVLLVGPVVGQLGISFADGVHRTALCPFAVGFSSLAVQCCRILSPTSLAGTRSGSIRAFRSGGVRARCRARSPLPALA